MKWAKKIVGLTTVAVIMLSIVSIVFYSALSAGGQRTLMFWLIVASAYTSLGGLFWALYTVYRYENQIGTQLDQLDQARQIQIQRLDPKFLNGLGGILDSAMERFNHLSHQRQERMLNIAERTVDNLFRRVEEMPEGKPERGEVVRDSGDPAEG